MSAMTPKAFAARYAMSLRSVLTLINSGTLPALNVAIRQDGQKPRWRILEEDAIAFEQSRRTQPKPPAQRRKSRKTEGITQYF
jgi:hypothetical protein